MTVLISKHSQDNTLVSKWFTTYAWKCCDVVFWHPWYSNTNTFSAFYRDNFCVRCLIQGDHQPAAIKRRDKFYWNDPIKRRNVKVWHGKLRMTHVLREKLPKSDDIYDKCVPLDEPNRFQERMRILTSLKIKILIIYLHSFWYFSSQSLTFLKLRPPKVSLNDSSFENSTIQIGSF